MADEEQLPWVADEEQAAVKAAEYAAAVGQRHEEREQHVEAEEQNPCGSHKTASRTGSGSSAGDVVEEETTAVSAGISDHERNVPRSSNAQFWRKKVGFQKKSVQGKRL